MTIICYRGFSWELPVIGGNISVPRGAIQLNRIIIQGNKISIRAEKLALYTQIVGINITNFQKCFNYNEFFTTV